MKALSVRQPFAEHIASGAKRIEYRGWPTDHRGSLLICASAALDPEALGDRAAELLPRGCTICLVDVVSCDWSDEDGQYRWHLRRPRRVEPAKVKGKLRFYDVPDELVKVARPAGRRR